MTNMDMACWYSDSNDEQFENVSIKEKENK